MPELRAFLTTQRTWHHAKQSARTFCRVALLFTLACQPQIPASDRPAVMPAPRLVTVGGAVTETVFALGWGHAVVGTDTSSVYPEAASQLPQVGYQRRLSAEGVLGLRPTAVLAAEEAGPPVALLQIRAAGVPVHLFPSPLTAAAAGARLRQVAGVLGAAARGEQLATALATDLARARGSARPGAARVLFIYARGAGTMLVAGRDTAADEVLRLAGAYNAAAALQGYKPLSSEAVVVAAPEVLLLTERGLLSLGGPDALFALPGVSLTPAGAQRRVVTLDDLLLLGFGPRTGHAVAQLQARLSAVLPPERVVAARKVPRP